MTINFTQELSTTNGGKALPPTWTSKATHYFENAYGEQWIAKYEDGKVYIAGLDIGWKEIILNGEQMEEYLDFRKNIFFVKSENKLMELLKKFQKSENPLSKWSLNISETYWVMGVLESFKMSMEVYEMDKEQNEETVKS